MRYLQILNRMTCSRRNMLIQLVNEPDNKTNSADKFNHHVEEARRFLRDNIEDILSLETCPRFVASCGSRIFYGEQENEVGYRMVMYLKREDASPGLILDLEPSAFRF